LSFVLPAALKKDLHTMKYAHFFQHNMQAKVLRNMGQLFVSVALAQNAHGATQ
jgi:hypothetical protein